MSFYIGKDTGGKSIFHMTSGSTSEASMKSQSPLTNTMFHSSSTYLKYDSVGQTGTITNDSGNSHRFYVRFGGLVASKMFSGDPVIILFKRTDSSYFSFSYSPTGSYYAATAYSTSLFELLVVTDTPKASSKIEKVIGISLAEKTYNSSNVRIDNTGIYLNGENILVNDYAIVGNSLHNSADLSLKFSEDKILQLYNSSTSWLPGIKIDSSTSTISRNSLSGYLPLVTSTKKLTPVRKIPILSSSHNGNGVVTLNFQNPLFSPGKKYLAVIKCYDDMAPRDIHFNYILDGYNTLNIIAYGSPGNSPTVRKLMQINSNGTITCVFFYMGFSEFRQQINNRIINGTGYIYEFQ